MESRTAAGVTNIGNASSTQRKEGIRRPGVVHCAGVVQLYITSSRKRTRGTLDRYISCICLRLSPSAGAKLSTNGSLEDVSHKSSLVATAYRCYGGFGSTVAPWVARE